MRLLAGLLLAALLPLAAGCGGSDVPGSASAGLVPGDVAAYVAIDTDFDGDGWQTAEDLLARFPDGEGLLDEAFAWLDAEGGVDFEQDVKPALGPETALVVLELAADSTDPPDVVLLTQPDDQAALERLLSRGDEPPVTAEVEGWTAAAETQQALDRFLSAREGPRLSDSESFDGAMAGLEEDALLRAYVDGETFATAAAAPVPGMEAFDALSYGVPLSALGFTLGAEDDGARLDGVMVFAESIEDTPYWSEPFEAELPEIVPGDAIAYVGFAGLDRVIGALRDALAEADPGFEREVGQLEGLLGVSLEEDLAPLLADEGALYVRPAPLVPEVTLVARVEDEAAAVDALDRLAAGAGRFLGAAAPTRGDVDGIEVRTLPIEPPLSLSYGAFDGLLVVTTSTDGIRDLREDGDKLADADAFRSALDRAGAPGETSGFAWLDVEETGSLLLGLAQLGGEDLSEARGYLEPLGSLVVHGTAADDTARFSLFLGVE